MKRKIHIIDALRMISYDKDYADIAREYSVIGVGARSILRDLNERHWRSASAIIDYLERNFSYEFSFSPGTGWSVKKYGSRRKKHAAAS